MACAPTHRTSQKVQGSGLCCAQVDSGLLAKTPGSVGPATTINTASGPRCGHCIVRASTNRKHPGKAVLGWRFGNPSGFALAPGQACPTSSGGCCSLAA